MNNYKKIQNIKSIKNTKSFLADDEVKNQYFLKIIVISFISSSIIKFIEIIIFWMGQYCINTFICKLNSFRKIYYNLIFSIISIFFLIDEDENDIIIIFK